MPPLPAFKVEALAQLERELRGAPRDRLLLDIDRAEALAPDISPDGAYPQDWVVFRVTGERPDIADPAVIPGRALLADLSTLVERLCAAARLRDGDMPAGSLLSAADAARRLGIGRRTIDRRRREGLIARRVLSPDGRPRLAFSAAVVARWSGASPRPATPPQRRFSADLAARMIRRARRYRALGCSLSAAAERIAARYSRSHEGVRRFLQRHDESLVRRGQAPVFPPDTLLDRHRRAVMLRAARRGVDLGAMATKFARSRSAVRRALALARAESLAVLLDSGAFAAHAGPTFELHDARAVLLAPAPVRTGLDAPADPDLASTIAAARAPLPAAPAVESARLIAYHYLLHAAAGAIRALDRLHPSPDAIDRIETDLRWAARLKAALVRIELRVVVGAIEGRAARPLDSLPPRDAAAILLESIRRAGGAIDALDPFRGGRLAGAVSLAVDRAAARLLKDHPAPPARRATPLAAHTPLPDWSRSLCPWQAALEPDARIRAVAPALPQRFRDFLLARYGWGGEAPRTLGEIGAGQGLDPIRAAALEQRAWRAAWAAARGETG